MSTQIVTGKKYHILTDLANKVWSTISFWTKASDVEFNDGKTAETKLGAIDGITSDLNGESETIAASIKAVHELNSSLGGNNLIYNESEDAYYIQHGADAALKKLGSGGIRIKAVLKGTGSSGGTSVTLTVTDADGNTLYSKKASNNTSSTTLSYTTP